MRMPQAGSHELRGLSWGDFDGDGDIDLLGGATAADKLTMVLRNDDGSGFVDVAAAIGLTVPGRSARQTNWIDYDNDGDLDVYASEPHRRQQAVSQRRRTVHARLRGRRADRSAAHGRSVLARRRLRTATSICISRISQARPMRCGATTAPPSLMSPPRSA